MSGYTFVIVIIAIIVLSLLWIPLNEAFSGSDGIVDALNNVTTDTDAREYNNIAGQVFYYTLFAFIIILGIYALKEGIKKEEPVHYG